MVLALWSFTAFHLHGHGAIEHGSHGSGSPDPSRVIVGAWGGDPPQAAQKQRPLLRPLDESSLGLNQKTERFGFLGTIPPTKMPMESQMKEN